MADSTNALVLVHLSDLHIRNQQSISLRRLSALAKEVGSVIEEPTEVVVLLSGDIAFSGSEDQYLLAETALCDFAKQLGSWPVNVSFMVSPGNHDLDFSAVSEGLRATLVSSDEIDGEQASATKA